MQTCNERDKQAKIIEELTQKFLNSESEKHEIEHWVSLDRQFWVKVTDSKLISLF